VEWIISMNVGGLSFVKKLFSSDALGKINFSRTFAAKIINRPT